MPPRKPAISSRKPIKIAREFSARDSKAPTVAKVQAEALILKLYVSSGSPNSLRAIANLEALCRNHAVEHSNIEIVDVFREPKRALEASVLLTPILVKVAPGQPVMILGNLNDTEAVLNALGLKGT